MQFLVPIYQNCIIVAKDLSNKIFSPLRHQDTKLNYTQVERFNVQGSGLMSPNSLNSKELRLNRGGKQFSPNGFK